MNILPGHCLNFTTDGLNLEVALHNNLLRTLVEELIVPHLQLLRREGKVLLLFLLAHVSGRRVVVLQFLLSCFPKDQPVTLNL